MELLIASEQAMESLGGRLADSITTINPSQGALIFLRGDLGAGKTTLVRGLLRHLGYQGAVKSPTYTLIEAYELESRHVYHLDLYRLQDTEELEYLGMRDFREGNTICLIEWPENGADRFFQGDLIVHIHYEGQGRRIEITGNTSVGSQMVDLLQQ